MKAIALALTAIIASLAAFVIGCIAGIYDVIGGANGPTLLGEGDLMQSADRHSGADSRAPSPQKLPFVIGGRRKGRSWIRRLLSPPICTYGCAPGDCNHRGGVTLLDILRKNGL